MSEASQNAYKAFQKKLCSFAEGRHGIRNPFVLVAVEPEVEHRVSQRLSEWVESHDGVCNSGDITAQTVRLDRLLSQTNVYRLCVDIGGESSPSKIKETMQNRLSTELVDEILEEVDDSARQSHIVLLLNLGSLFPFSRASELLDELDRRNVKSTVGIPFPGNVVSGSLNFFDTESRHYYPAHQIDGEITWRELQE